MTIECRIYFQNQECINFKTNLTFSTDKYVETSCIHPVVQLCQQAKSLMGPK